MVVFYPVAETADSQRYLSVTDGPYASATVIAGGQGRMLNYPSSASATVYEIETLHRFSDGDELGSQVFQNSGATDPIMDIDTYLESRWLSA